MKGNWIDGFFGIICRMLELQEYLDEQLDTAEYETVDITLLSRGVIGVNKIGYVFQ